MPKKIKVVDIPPVDAVVEAVKIEPEPLMVSLVQKSAQILSAGAMDRSLQSQIDIESLVFNPNALIDDMVVRECKRDAFGVSHLVRNDLRWCQRKTPKSCSGCFSPAVQYRVTVGVDDRDAGSGEDYRVSRVDKWS